MELIPVDNLLTIFNNLHINDIINISKVNKYFRNIIKENTEYINIFVEIIDDNSYLNNIIDIFPNIKLSYDLNNTNIDLLKKNKNNIYKLNISYTNIPDAILNDIYFNNLNILILTYCKYIDGLLLNNINLNNILLLDLSGTNVADDNLININLNNIKELYLTDCYNITGSFLKDKILTSLKILCLSNTNVSDYSLKNINFKNIDILYLCFNIITNETINSKILCNIKYLDLSYCHYITDISNLHNIETLIIVECSNITSESINIASKNNSNIINCWYSYYN
jgi:hypothetical protein